MLRKALTLGIVFILALSLLAVSMITCFTYDAEAEREWDCEQIGQDCVRDPDSGLWNCILIIQCIERWHTHG